MKRYRDLRILNSSSVFFIRRQATEARGEPSSYQHFSPDYHGYAARMDVDQTEQQKGAEIA
jgi:hypothetical protein